jgi:soluble lytic murein transglycosylase
MPGTARDMAKLSNRPAVAAMNDAQITAWLRDPANAAASREMGRAYLGQLVDRYDGNPALALAAYNAGPGRLEGGRDKAGVYHPGWLKTIGDPRTGGITADAWVAALPFSETRTYLLSVLPDAYARLKRGG